MYVGNFGRLLLSAVEDLYTTHKRAVTKILVVLLRLDATLCRRLAGPKSSFSSGFQKGFPIAGGASVAISTHDGPKAPSRLHCLTHCVLFWLFVFPRDNHCSLVDRRPSAFYCTRITSNQGGDRSFESPMSLPAVVALLLHRWPKARACDKPSYKNVCGVLVATAFFTTPTPPPLLPPAERGPPNRGRNEK